MAIVRTRIRSTPPAVLAITPFVALAI